MLDCNTKMRTPPHQTTRMWAKLDNLRGTKVLDTVHILGVPASKQVPGVATELRPMRSISQEPPAVADRRVGPVSNRSAPPN